MCGKMRDRMSFVTKISGFCLVLRCVLESVNCLSDSCLDGWHRYGDYCVKSFSESVNHLNAERMCYLYYAQLPIDPWSSYYTVLQPKHFPSWLRNESRNLTSLGNYYLLFHGRDKTNGTCIQRFYNGSIVFKDCKDKAYFVCQYPICQNPLGMTNYKIQDSQITASSIFDIHRIGLRTISGFQAFFARLNLGKTPGQPSLGGWCANESDATGNPFIEITFFNQYRITGISLQGVNDNQNKYWTKTYQLKTSADGIAWVDYRDSKGNIVIFNGTYDADTIITSWLSENVVGSRIRIYPISGGQTTNIFTGLLCLRLELYGCRPFEMRTMASEERQYEDRFSNSARVTSVRNNAGISWPSGNYLLLQGKDGCPDSYMKSWRTGYHLVDLRGLPKGNTSRYFLEMQGDSRNFQVNAFCLRTEGFHLETQIPFPPGNYCVYKTRFPCPGGFQQGSLTFNEPLGARNWTWSHFYGVTPEVVYEYDTRNSYCCYATIQYCCRSDGGKGEHKAQLSQTSSFLLFPTTNSCQEFNGYKAEMGHIDYVIGNGTASGNVSSGMHPYFLILEHINPSAKKEYFLRHFVCIYELDNTVYDIVLSPSSLQEVNANYPLDIWFIPSYHSGSITKDSTVHVSANCISILGGKCSVLSVNHTLTVGTSPFSGSISFSNSPVNISFAIQLGTYQKRASFKAQLSRTLNIMLLLPENTTDTFLLSLNETLTPIIVQERNRSSWDLRLKSVLFTTNSDLYNSLTDTITLNPSHPNRLHGIIAINTHNVENTLNSIGHNYDIPVIFGVTDKSTDEKRVNSSLLYFELAKNTEEFKLLNRFSLRAWRKIAILRDKKTTFPFSFVLGLITNNITVVLDIFVEIIAEENFVTTSTWKQLARLKTEFVDAIYCAVNGQSTTALFRAAVMLEIAPVYGFHWVTGLSEYAVLQAFLHPACQNIAHRTCSSAFYDLQVFQRIDKTGNPLVTWPHILLQNSLQNLTSKENSIQTEIMLSLISEAVWRLSGSHYTIVNNNKTVTKTLLHQIITANYTFGISLSLSDYRKLKEMAFPLCSKSWSGENCSRPICFTFTCKQTHGKCIAPNVCECFKGYYGLDCSNKCSDSCKNGICSEGRLGTGKCLSCDWQYTGEACDKATILNGIIAAVFGFLVVVFVGSCYILRHLHEKSSKFVADDSDSDILFEWSDLGDMEPIVLLNTQHTKQMTFRERFRRYFKGRFKDRHVFVKSITKPPIKLSLDTLRELQIARSLDHRNIDVILGVVTGPPYVAVVTEATGMGSLYDVLTEDHILVPWDVKYAIMEDICRGMVYLHENMNISHGRLKSSNCIIHQGWLVKISDIGLKKFKSIFYESNQEVQMKPETPQEDLIYSDFEGLLWTAPEYLCSGVRNLDQLPTISKKGDTYSFGIIMAEILTRRAPLSEITVMTVEHIIEAIGHLREVTIDFDAIRPLGLTKQSKGSIDMTGKCLRPLVLDQHFPADEGERSILRLLMESCWSEDPQDRPPFRYVLEALEILTPLKGNIMEKRAVLLQRETESLEQYIAYDVQQILVEKQKVEDFLSRLYPNSVVKLIMTESDTEQCNMTEATITVIRLSDFADILQKTTPDQLISYLDYIFKTIFTLISENKLNVYEIGSLNGKMVFGSGYFDNDYKQHAEDNVSLVFHLLRVSKHFKLSFAPDLQTKFRVGVHTGQISSALARLSKGAPRYLIFGEAMRVANTVEQKGAAGRIHTTHNTVSILRKNPNIKIKAMINPACKIRADETVLNTYWLDEI